MDITVRGATLAGMAAAARLARLGHRVTLVTDGGALGGRWAPVADGPGGHAVDAMPQVIRLPATWRDLFKKSGGHLQAELNRAGLELTPAPPSEHRFADGTALALPTDRGGQLRAVGAAFGTTVADRWSRLTGDLVNLWRAYREHALEGVLPVTTRAQRHALWLDRTLADVADGLGPQLGRLVTDLGPGPGSPGTLAVALHVDLLFGRWQLTDAAGTPQRASRLVDLLAARLTERGVTLVPDGAGPDDVDCRPHLPPGTWLRRPAAATAPRTSHEFHAQAPATGGTSETVDHTGARPVVTWLRPTADGALATRHDHGHPTPDPAWGAATPSARAWLRRSPVIGSDGTLRASAASPAGAAPWAELGSAALAVYELHERLTGEDSRPTNKDFRPARLER